MKKGYFYELAVGIVFFTAVGFLSYYTIFMVKKIAEPRDSYEMTVIFPSADGLNESDKVKINGVLAGTVKSVDIIDYRVIVTLKVFKRFVMYENFQISIRSEAALGGKHVNIFLGTPADTSGKKFMVVEERTDLPGKVEDAINSITELVEENRGNLYSSLKNIKDITEKINSGQGTIGQLINNDTIHKNTDDLVKELREAIEDSREQAPVTSFIRAALLAF